MRFGGSQNSAPSNFNLSPGGKCLNLAVKCCEIMKCPHLCSEGMKIKAGRVQNRDTQKGKNSAKHLGSTMHKGFTQLPTQQARITKCDLHLAMPLSRNWQRLVKINWKAISPALPANSSSKFQGIIRYWVVCIHDAPVPVPEIETQREQLWIIIQLKIQQAQNCN